MAYVKVGSTASANRALSYIDKDDRAIALNGNTSDPTKIQSVKQEMMATRVQWAKNDKIQAHIIYQSFKAEECDPETANKIGCQLAEKIAPGYQYVVATHTDAEGGNIHNHIMLNAVAIDTGIKFKSSHFLQESRRISNDICKAYGLSIIEEKAKLKYTMAEKALLDKGIMPWKDQIRDAIDRHAPASRNLAELQARLRLEGINAITRGKHITYSIDGHKVRGATLGSSYGVDRIKGLAKEYAKTAEKSPELHCNWDSVKKCHAQINDGKGTTALRSIDNKLKSASTSQVKTKLNTVAWIYDKGVVMPIKITANTIATIGKVAGVIPVIGKPIQLVLSAPKQAVDTVIKAGRSIKQTGKAIVQASKASSSNEQAKKTIKSFIDQSQQILSASRPQEGTAINTLAADMARSLNKAEYDELQRDLEEAIDMGDSDAIDITLERMGGRD